ncbi:hypothetical protein DL96DRAFT_418575 [Flagelloscypha sp. PMI_526]|nr:hypothetical protein DL96DRAFT_418575 [Flagelloscypha sp. PMI_526]
MFGSSRLLLELIFIFLPTAVYAFTFSAVQNGQCGPMTVTWADGKGPYTIGIHPFGGTGKTVSVPDSQVSNGQGSMEITLEIPTGKNFLVTMGDSQGPLTGGTSPVLTAGAASSNAAAGCNTTYRTPDFFWSAGQDAVKQCGAYPFTEIGTAAGAKIQRPTTLFVLIPGGDQSFAVTMPNAPSFVWTADLKQGTQIVFDMLDSAGNQGGVAPQPATIAAGDSSCTFHDASQKSSAAASGATATATDSAGGGGGGISRGMLIGIAVGGAAIAALIAFLIYLLVKRQNQRRRYHDKPVNLLSYEGNNGGYQDLEPYDPVPLPAGAIAQPYTVLSPTRTPSEYSTSYAASSYTSHSGAASMYPKHGGQKRGYSTTQAPIIQHSDIADDNPPEPVELPPQYSATRAPLQGYSDETGMLSPSLAPSGSSHASGSASGSSSFGAASGSSGPETPGRSLSMRKGPR